MKRQVKVSGAFIEKDGFVLLAQRNEADSFGLKWEFPGGAVEENETPEVCLKRELMEELGVEVENLEFIGTFEDEIPALKIEIFLYRCRIKNGIPRPLECKDVKWVRFVEIGSLDLAPADRKIYDFLRKNFYGFPRPLQ